MEQHDWDQYCEKGFRGCMSQTCACGDNPHSRYLNARRRGLSRLRSWLYALRFVKYEPPK